MKLLLENWRRYMKETNSYRRVVLNELVEITEEELRDFPLSKEELNEIRKWAQLEGEPLFLGSGTMGSAYQFGDLVLKITKDYAEASAAQTIAGQVHPNVYKIKKVARRFGMEGTGPEQLPNHPFLIVYELVGSELGGPDLPTRQQQDIIKTIYAQPHDIYYNWVNNLDEIKNKFLNWVSQNPAEPEENPISKFKNHEDKLDLLLSAAGLDEREKEILKAAWGVSVGFYGADNINSSQGVQNALANPSFNYVDDVSKGLTFLEQNGIHFRDLKTTNVMNDNGKLVIIDIGKSSVRNRQPIPVLGGKNETPT